MKKQSIIFLYLAIVLASFSVIPAFAEEEAGMLEAIESSSAISEGTDAASISSSEEIIQENHDITSNSEINEPIDTSDTESSTAPEIGLEPTPTADASKLTVAESNETVTVDTGSGQKQVIPVQYFSVSGTEIIIDNTGSVYTRGTNQYGLLGNNGSADQQLATYQRVNLPYTISVLEVNNDTVKAFIAGRTDEYLTWGKNTPNFEVKPQSFVDSLPEDRQSSQAVYVKLNGGKIQTVTTFIKYGTLLPEIQFKMEINHQNSDKDIGHVNDYIITKSNYSEDTLTGKSRTYYYYDYAENYLKLNIFTELDADEFKVSQESTWFDSSGKKIKYFKPSFQKGNNVESSEWVESYKADGSKTTVYKEFDEKGYVYSYAPEYQNRGFTGTFVKQERNEYNANGKRTQYALTEYYADDQDGKKIKQGTSYDYTQEGVITKYANSKYTEAGNRTEYIAITYTDGILNTRWLERYNAAGAKYQTASTVYEEGIKKQYGVTELDPATGKKKSLEITYYDIKTKLAIEKSLRIYLEGNDSLTTSAKNWKFYPSGAYQSIAETKYNELGQKTQYINDSYADKAGTGRIQRFTQIFDPKTGALISQTTTK